MLRIDLVFPVLPPRVDGIGDYTARLARALGAHGCDVRILTAQDETAVQGDVTVERAFDLPPRRGIQQIAKTVRSDPPDWLVLQFNQFSYGRWGLNPYLPLVMWQLQRACPAMDIAVMFHEDFVPPTTWKNAIMTAWQRAQFWALGHTADRVLFSIEPWAHQYGPWFPSTPTAHVPVGSNIPHVDADREAVRTKLGAGEDVFVLGVFGTLRQSRLLGHIRSAAEAVQCRTEALQLLYVGPDGDAFQEFMRGLPVINAGLLSPCEVSRHFAAMDLYLAPFLDGASTRRGSLLVGLQHGVPTVSTRGRLTDSILTNQHQQALLLPPAGDQEAFQEAVVSLHQAPDRRARMKDKARRFFSHHFGWTSIADRFLKVLSATD
jgi:glycosyltransferase involved in cell wall biosynthesis